ncbi:hypothetical protein CkP1_0287 [Citrobacter phage CkP1]|nr:hypothetical protein CkP1_0287 [Citrobacter phage CkP1]
MSKVLLTTSVLEKAGASSIGLIKNGDWHNGAPVKEVSSRPGFYFLVNVHGWTVARFYVGRQRSKTGFDNVLSQIRRGRSYLGRTLRSNNNVYTVAYVPVGNMKALTNGYKKGQLALMFTPTHKDSFQNMEEMNRMLNDNFKFSLQSY